MPRPKRTRALVKPTASKPAAAKPEPPKPDPTRREPRSDDFYDDIDDSKITVIQDNSFKGSGQGLPTHLGDIGALQARINRENSQEKLVTKNAPSTDKYGPSRTCPDVEISRREHTPPRRTFGADMSGLDLDDDMFGADANLDASFEDDRKDHVSASKSHNNSSFTISNFRRRGRSRTSSFVGGNTGSMRPSSRGNNTTVVSSTLNLGAFKRREREPSILGTAQKKRSLRPDDNDVSVSELDDIGDVEGFAHRAEGSPLRRKSRRAPSAKSDSSGGDMEISDFQTKKRKFSDAQHEGGEVEERPSKILSIESDHDESAEVPELVSSSVPASPQSLPPVEPVPNQREDDPEIIAPPESSDSEECNLQLPPLQAARRRRPSLSRKTPPTMAHDHSEPSSPPSLTHSPNYPPPRPTRAHPAVRNKEHSETLSTEELAKMLGRRRRRREASDDGLDIESNESSSENDEDDESYVNCQQLKRKQPPQANTSAAPAASKCPTSRGAGANTSNSGNKRKPRRTYGKSIDKENFQEAERSDADQEFEEGDSIAPMKNAELGDEPSEMLVKRVGTELKQARRKFQEVDKWDLVFEEVIRSSSPAGAR
ncbi:hypothetical protein MKZ38_005399 [Zalerion maritima]|uniref:Uncharacterized protein n=1 Tax=Zalerion maritima TaxID=339359 RepID=A0AAD5RL79_9PEZI|nr:hypothetical protein MKZ38_005399 [Zalerion maritima]